VAGALPRFLGRAKQLQTTAPIGVGTKDHLSLIAARNHVVKRTGKINSGFCRQGFGVITTATVKDK
jgi:hypothetical protein